MKAPRTSLTSEHEARAAIKRARVGADPTATPRDDAERAQSTRDLQRGLHVTDVSDTMPLDLIEQLFPPPGHTG